MYNLNAITWWASNPVPWGIISMIVQQEVWTTRRACVDDMCQYKSHGWGRDMTNYTTLHNSTVAKDQPMGSIPPTTTNICDVVRLATRQRYLASQRWPHSTHCPCDGIVHISCKYQLPKSYCHITCSGTFPFFIIHLVCQSTNHVYEIYMARRTPLHYHTPLIVLYWL